MFEVILSFGVQLPALQGSGEDVGVGPPQAAIVNVDSPGRNPMDRDTVDQSPIRFAVDARRQDLSFDSHVYQTTGDVGGGVAGSAADWRKLVVQK
jgi:hypothetical protein